MKRILILAMACTLATGAFAIDKPKKLKKNKQCSTQQNCKPEDCKPSDCKPKNCCTIPNCKKA